MEELQAVKSSSSRELTKLWTTSFDMEGMPQQTRSWWPPVSRRRNSRHSI